MASSPQALSPEQRGELARQFVLKWGAYVQGAYGIPVRTWADRMVPTLARADESNLRNALLRSTFEGANSELLGRGHANSDEAISRKMLRIANSATGELDNELLAIGSLDRDLSFTPLQPCRIVDTRNTVAGKIPAGGSRNFLGINASTYASQGGSDTDCGTLGLNATALALNVTSVSHEGTGHAIVYPYGTAIPTSASLNYSSTTVAQNNGIIARIPNPLGAFDFTIWTAQRSHFVVDIVGYFAPPVATALQCMQTAPTNVPVESGSTANASATTCPVGYTETGTNCQSSSWEMPFVFVSGGICSARNNGSGAATLRASRTCCRVPGR